MDMLKNTFFLGVLRHVLTTLGGFLVAQDLATGAQWDTLVAGLMVAIGIGWSMIDKQRRT